MKTEPVADLELIALEEAFADDCKCESNHVDTHCSVFVTHSVTTHCGRSGLVCENAAVRAGELSAPDSLRTCGYCHNRHSVCGWTIRPI